jgi:GPN-loop GTPase
MLYACSILYKTKLPMILVFNKTDIRDASFAKEWMTDYDAFQAALRQDEINNAFGGTEGSGDGMGMGSGYMGSLLNSMSMMLEEFYRHLSVVGVSSMTGHGVDDFFEAVAGKVEEFQRDYQPELDKRRQERDDTKRKARERELDKLMKGMTVSGTASAALKVEEKTPRDESDELGDEDMDDRNEDDEIVDEDDRVGLQARYDALAGESLGADASFANYLISQR